MGKKDRTVPVTLEEQKNSSLDVLIGKQKFGQIVTNENEVIATLVNGFKIEGKSIDEVLGRMIAEYNLHS